MTLFLAFELDATSRILNGQEGLAHSSRDREGVERVLDFSAQLDPGVSQLTVHFEPAHSFSRLLRDALIWSSDSFACLFLPTFYLLLSF